MNYVVGFLGLLLALSLAANGYFWHERDKAIAAQATADQLNVDTKAAASACTTSVDALGEAGKKRDASLLSALGAIAPQVAKMQRESLESLRAKPDDPNDLCGSLLRYWQGQIGKEAQP